MSSIEPGGIVQFHEESERRRLYSLLAMIVLAAGAIALYFEPWFVLGRIRTAVLTGDLEAQRELIEPGLLETSLPPYLELSRPRKGTTVVQRYATWSSFVVIARAAWTDEPSWAGVSEIRLVLERHGLSWWLTGVDSGGLLAGGPGTEPQPIPPPAPDDSLPAFGMYVYVEELPEAVTRVAPLYPELAREAGVEGTVLVQALVGRDGLVKDARISRSIPMLDGAALVAVRQWQFIPAKSKGQPVAVWVAAPVKFTLH